MPGDRLVMAGLLRNTIGRERGTDKIRIDGIEHIADGVGMAIGSDHDGGTKDDR